MTCDFRYLALAVLKKKWFLIPMSKFTDSDFRSVKSATKKRKTPTKVTPMANPAKKKSKKAKKTSSGSGLAKKSKKAKSTNLTQYYSSGSTSATRVGATRQIVGAMPSPESIKRTKEATKRAALEQTALMTSAATSAAIGYAESQGSLNSIPGAEQAANIGGPTVVLGAIAFIASKLTKSKVLDGIANGALSVAAYNAGKAMGAPPAGTGGVAGMDEEEWE